MCPGAESDFNKISQEGPRTFLLILKKEVKQKSKKIHQKNGSHW